VAVGGAIIAMELLIEALGFSIRSIIAAPLLVGLAGLRRTYGFSSMDFQRTEYYVESKLTYLISEHINETGLSRNHALKAAAS